MKNFTTSDLDGDRIDRHRVIWYSKDHIAGWLAGSLSGTDVFFTFLPNGNDECNMGNTHTGCMNAIYLQDNPGATDLDVTDAMVGHEIRLNSNSGTDCVISEPCYSDVNQTSPSGITPESRPPYFSSILVEEHKFAVNVGFPKTGFIGAEFTLILSSGDASAYDWSSNASWVSVDNSGHVSFTGKGNTSSVTITASPKAGGEPVTYTFALDNWFINQSDMQVTYEDAIGWCKSLGSNSRLASESEYSLGKDPDDEWRPLRGIGKLFTEWGRLYKYTNSNFKINHSFFALEHDGYHWVMVPSNGFAQRVTNSAKRYVTCIGW
ncbi:hypothetical protein [Aeromonas sp. JL9]|uniref:hypothetical protein n=1 Tax=Aeromonas sp. JL9 TaxID=2950549 RepID=UPI00210A3102|nr:hypothetical protein [Aeromonas sp. JL9]MCQ4111554.1 hypothetical protein [Aeromonas sp. JL9]